MLKLLETHEVELLLKYCQWRYGMSEEIFSHFKWVKSSRNIYLVAQNAHHILGLFPLKKMGMRAFSGKQFPYRATTGFIQRFGKFASQGVIDISQDQLEALLTSGPLDLALLNPGHYHPGPVILRVNGMDIGAGAIQGNQLVSQISLGRVYQFLRSNISQGTRIAGTL